MVDPATDANLHAALHPRRPDPDRFAANVRARLAAPEANEPVDPLAGASPFVRAAASWLPLPVVAGGNVALAGKTLAIVPGGWKIVSFLVFPAASLFVLIAACFGGVVGVRRVQTNRGPALADPAAAREAATAWFQSHRWGLRIVFFVAMGLITFGGTGLVFFGLIGSFGVLLVVLRSLARVGLGDRASIGSSCTMGLMFLAQMAIGSRFSDGDLHFVNPAATGLVLLAGAGACFPFVMQRRLAQVEGMRPKLTLVGSGLVMLVLAVGLASWQLGPTLRPITPEQLRRHVEAFDNAPHSTVSWRHWGIEAQWAIDHGDALDLSVPRRFLATGGAEATNPFVLGAAARAGLIPPADFARLPDFDSRLHSLVDDPYGKQGTYVITSLEQEEYVIRGAVATKALTDAQRDLLARRLNLTLDRLDEDIYDVLDESRLITRLLAAIDRPVDVARRRPLIQRWLRDFQSRAGGGFQRAGGFRKYRSLATGTIESTEAAIDLMVTFGVPEGVDLDWVRSFVQPSALTINDPWVAAVARFRLDRLTQAPPPSWWAIAFAERTLGAALALVGLCFYAILSSPRAASPTNLPERLDPPG